MNRQRQESGSRFDRAYSLVVAGKGMYGVVELVAGTLLLLAPGLASQLLTAGALELAEGSAALPDAASQSLAAAGAGVAAGAAPLALFLLVHGVVKVLTAYALLRRAIRWYPWALAALGVLLVVQVVDLTVAPSVGAAVLAVLDAGVIALVLWEYRRLRRDNRSKLVATNVPPWSSDDRLLAGSDPLDSPTGGPRAKISSSGLMS